MRPDLRVPPFLRDLLRDMRDRRLLPLAAVMVVAIIAVPFALSSSESSPAPTGLAVHPGADDSASTFAVVADDPGLRDYHRRLRGDTPKNPFVQQYAPPKSTGTEAGGGTIGGAAVGSGVEQADTGGSTTSETTGTGSEGAQPDSSGGGSEPSQPDQGGGEPEPAYVLHLRIGPPGDLKPRDLSAPAPLPGLDNPVLVFRGLSSNGHEGVFRVDESVSAIHGDAKCRKGTDRCEVVEIAPGNPVNFVYGEKDKVLRLTVVGIDHNR
jgi:hypothetical protein